MSWEKPASGSEENPVPEANHEVTRTEGARIGPDGNQRDWGDVTELWAYAGQSNALGQGGTASQAPEPFDGEVYRYQPSEPRQPDGDVANLSQMSQESNAWPAFANEYIRNTGRRICITGWTQTGSAQHHDATTGNLSHWDPAGTYSNGYPNLLALENTVRSAIDALQQNGHNVRFRGILWMQGERDAQAIDNSVINDAQYRDAFYRMLDEMEGLTDDIKGGPLPEPWRWYVFETAHETSAGAGDTTGYQQVRARQSEVALNRERVRMASIRQQTFPDRGLMDDEIHYNQEGLNEAGRVGARAVACAENKSQIPLDKGGIIRFGDGVGGDITLGTNETGSNLIVKNGQGSVNLTAGTRVRLSSTVWAADTVFFRGGRARHSSEDVRNASVSNAGVVSYHDGSGTNTEGPAFYDGSNWISIVDGSTIS